LTKKVLFLLLQKLKIVGTDKSHTCSLTILNLDAKDCPTICLWWNWNVASVWFKSHLIGASGQYCHSIRTIQCLNATAGHI